MARRAAVDPVAAAYLDGVERPFVQQRVLFDRWGYPLPTPRWCILHAGRLYPQPSHKRALELATHRAHWDGGRWIPRTLYAWPHGSVRPLTRRPA